MLTKYIPTNTPLHSSILREHGPTWAMRIVDGELQEPRAVELIDVDVAAIRVQYQHDVAVALAQHAVQGACTRVVGGLCIMYVRSVWMHCIVCV